MCDLETTHSLTQLAELPWPLLFNVIDWYWTNRTEKHVVPFLPKLWLLFVVLPSTMM